MHGFSNDFDQMFMRALIDRRTSHLAEIDIAEELHDGQTADAGVFIARTVEDVIQHFDHLKEHNLISENHPNEPTQNA